VVERKSNVYGAKPTSAKFSRGGGASTNHSSTRMGQTQGGITQNNFNSLGRMNGLNNTQTET